MGHATMSKGEISARVAEQMRAGIALGEMIYNFYVKGQLAQSRELLVKVSKYNKHTYLMCLHTLGRRMHVGESEKVITAELTIPR